MILIKLKNTLPKVLYILVFLCSLSYFTSGCIVDISKENCVFVKGEVEKIYEGGSFDVMIKLKSDNRIFYINRGLEYNFVLADLQKDLTGKEIAFWHAKSWVQDGGHITQVEFEEKILYTEWKN